MARPKIPPVESTPPVRISVLERRLQNPFGEPSFGVKFKDSSLEGRWFNEETRNGQIYRAGELGWEPVTADMIADVDTLGFHVINPAGQVSRGPRGQEILMYMPAKDRAKIQAAKTAENIRKMGNPHAQRREVLEAFGQQHPDHAEAIDRTDRASGGGPFMEIRDSYERVQQLDPTEE